MISGYILLVDFFEKDNTGQERTPVAPLADRMRPRSFDEFVGQQKIIGEGTPLRKAIEEDRVFSVIFWGPPGSGKTTLAQLIAKTTKGEFVPFSAVTSGIKEVKVVLSKSSNYYKMSGRRTYVFIDEIHRFNKAQQDAFLPYVEKGDVILIGATTENPSFEVINALLSRMRVYVLERLTKTEIASVINRALDDTEIGLGGCGLALNDDAMDLICSAADGDARRGLSLLEGTAAFVGEGGIITAEAVKQVSLKTALQYDKDGEEHYNLISALHKTIRGGDPDASLYWLARMLEGGQDPRYIVRRLVRFATEDIGLADPYALTLALNARDTYNFLGSPEGELAIAEAVVYMACAPKSNAVYTAFDSAMKDASTSGSLPVPLWIRNAPTKLMKALNYGKNYKYAHDYKDGLTDQEYFPDEIAGREYYRPTESGKEIRLAEYLRRYRQFRRKVKQASVSTEKEKN